MTRQIPSMQNLEGADNVWTVRRGNLRCTAIALADEGLCLYSPVEKASKAFADAKAVQFLLAPNHYHNKGISEHVTTYPEAALVCSDAARPRLEKVTGRQFGSLSALSNALPPNVDLVEPDGLKTGEVWMVVRTGKDVVWVVTDTFCGVLEKGDDAARFGFLKTFPKYGLQDKQRLSTWIGNRLETEVPSIVVPCHGEIVRGANLKPDMLALLDTL